MKNLNGHITSFVKDETRSFVDSSLYPKMDTYDNNNEGFNRKLFTDRIVDVVLKNGHRFNTSTVLNIQELLNNKNNEGFDIESILNFSFVSRLLDVYNDHPDDDHYQNNPPILLAVDVIHDTELKVQSVRFEMEDKYLNRFFYVDSSEVCVSDLLKLYCMLEIIAEET